MIFSEQANLFEALFDEDSLVSDPVGNYGYYHVIEVGQVEEAFWLLQDELYTGLFNITLRSFIYAGETGIQGAV